MDADEPSPGAVAEPPPVEDGGSTTPELEPEPELERKLEPELADSAVEGLPVAKGYRYEAISQSWADLGQGSVAVEGERLIMRGQAGIVLAAPVLSPERYEVEGWGVVVWTDERGQDVALSFEREEGARSIIAVLKPPFLPRPSLAALPDLQSRLAATVGIGLAPSRREAMVAEVLDETWLLALVELVNTCDDLEDEDSLETLFSVIKNMVLLHPREVCARLLADDVFATVFTALEWDPGIPRDIRLHHREWLEKNTQFHEVVAMSEELRACVDKAYRLAYLKDTALPRWFEDSTLMQFSHIVSEKHSEILSLLDEESADSLVEVVRAGAPDGVASNGPRERPRGIMFMQQALFMAKMLPEQRTNLYRMWVERGVFDVLMPYLEHEGEGRLPALDVLLMGCFHNVLPFREFCVNDARGFATLVNLLTRELDTSIQTQVGDILRAVLEAGQLTPLTVRVLERWYAEPLDRLVHVLRCSDQPTTQHLVLDLLAYCAENHQQSCYAFTRNSVVHHAAGLLQNKSKLVLLGVVRLFRGMVRNSTSWSRFLVSHNFLLQLVPLLNTRAPLPTWPKERERAGEMVSSAVLELFASLKSDQGQSAQRELLMHVCDEKSPLRAFKDVATLRELFQAHDALAAAPDPVPCAPSAASSDTGAAPRWSMREELAEEAYFDQSDEEEPPSPRTPGSPQRSSRSPSPLDAASLPREDVEAEVVAAKLRSPTHESSSSPNLADSTALPAMPFLELPEGTADTESDVAAPEQPHKKVRRT